MFINFHPGNTQEKREVSVDQNANYGETDDLGYFIESLRDGRTASIKADGIKAALEDGELLGSIAAEYGFSDAELQELTEELHAAI